MKKTLAAIALMFTLTGCVSGETQALEQIASNTAPTSSQRPVSQPKPVLRTEGRTWEENLAFHDIDVPVNYLGQLCSYLKPVVEDQFLSKSEFDPIIIRVFYDTGSKYNTQQLAALYVSSVMKDCPEYISIIKGS